MRPEVYISVSDPWPEQEGEKLPASVEIVMSCWMVADQIL